MKNAPKNLLNIKIKDLTPAILAELEKPLGTSERPYPMWGSQRIEHGGKSDLEQVLSVISSDSEPMKVYSDRPYKEVIALAYCDMVVPSMLPLFFDGLERRKPESTNRTQMVIGNPGAGKSFMGAMQGRLRSNKAVEVFDCGGKNMNELLFEMVLDFGAGDALPVSIDKRLKAGTLQAVSMGLIDQLNMVDRMPAMPADVALDPARSKKWEDDFKKWHEENKPVSYTAEGTPVIDWEKLRAGSKEKMDEVYGIVTKISKIEGLDNAGGNALGMNSQYGPLIRWFMEGREGVLDEYNKSREGSDNSLQTVWQFLIGEIPVCTVENPLKNKDATSGPSSFTFKREDMQTGFFVTLTGNKTEDGVTTRSLNKSVYSRLSPQTLPDPDVIDWQHRICQMMVGLPVSTLYTVFKDQADKDPDAFGDWLIYLRKSKAEIEGVAVPALQDSLLQDWQRVVRSSEKLAKFYDKWAAMTDSEKIMQGHSDLVEEVDEEYSKKEGIDFRKIKQHLEEAIPIRPRMQPYDAPVALSLGNWDKPPVAIEKVPESPALAFGTRLVEFLDRMVYEKTAAIGKHRLYEQLRKSMVEFGLRDVHLMEGARSKQKSVEEDLNVSIFTDRDLGKQARMARKVLCDYIRQADPSVTAEDDQIITMKKLRDALEYVGQKDTEKTKEIFVVNRDHETLSSSPLEVVRIEDVAVYQRKLDIYEEAVSHIPVLEEKAPKVAKEIQKLTDQIKALKAKAGDVEDQIDNAEKQLKALKTQATDDNNKLQEFRATEKMMKGNMDPPQVSLEDLVNHDDFIASLALPTVSGKNISAIWDTNIRPLSGGQSVGSENDEPLFMAENRSPQGIATTTLRVADSKGERDVSIHIVRNNTRNKTLIVSEKAPSKLLAAFREAGITHVDRNDPNAKIKVEAALNDLTRSLPEKTRGHLVSAFKYRNNIDTEQQQGKTPELSDILIDGRAEMMFDKFLVKVPKRARHG